MSPINGDWPKAVDELIRTLYERGLPDAAIADAVKEEHGFHATRHTIRHRAGALGLEKDLENGTAAIFRKPRTYKHLELSRVKEGSRLIVVNDMQIPFHDPATLKAVEAFMIEFEPTHFVVAGDGYDFYNMSVFDQNPSRGIRLQEELDYGRRITQRWETMMPNADLYWIDGNHEDRLRKWLWRHGPAISNLRSLEPMELMHLEKWQHLTYGSSIEFMGVIIEHGDVARSKAGYTAWSMFIKRGKSGIVGHTHRLAMIHNSDAAGDHIYIENGCLCRLDPEYTPRPDWQQAFTYGIVHKGELALFPVRIRPYGFRAEGRWYPRKEG